jgi:hypothetical protein
LGAQLKIKPKAYKLMQQRIVFDIETVGKDFSEFDSTTQNYFIEKFKFEHHSHQIDETEMIRLLEEQFGLMPQTGEVIVIGFYNPDSNKGAVYFQAPQADSAQIPESFNKDNFEYTRVNNEKELLVKFWEIIPRYSEIISFNGKGFDLPFLYIRSAVHQIKPVRNNLIDRYSPHIDLYEKFSFDYKLKKTSLHLLAKTFGLTSPKDDIDGRQVKHFYRAGECVKIAEYCKNDVLVTAKLYEIWSKYLRNN